MFCVLIKNLRKCVWRGFNSMGYCKKDITPLLTHWSYVFLALTHWIESVPWLVWVVAWHLTGTECVLTEVSDTVWQSQGHNELSHWKMVFLDPAWLIVPHNWMKIWCLATADSRKLNFSTRKLWAFYSGLNMIMNLRQSATSMKSENSSITFAFINWEKAELI